MFDFKKNCIYSPIIKIYIVKKMLVYMKFELIYCYIFNIVQYI